MKLFNMIKKFRNDESGAVTVDWVVLTAAIVGLGIAVLASVETGLTNTVAGIENNVAGEATQTYQFGTGASNTGGGS